MDFKAYFKEDYKKGIKEIERSSKIKGIIFFVLGIAMTCTVQLIVYRVHPSNFTGQRFEDYLIKQICKEYDFEEKEKVFIQNISEMVTEDNLLLAEKYLFVTGKYDNKYTFIAIFGKEEKKFWDFLFSTEPVYKLKQKYCSEIWHQDELNFSAFKSVDMDGDLKNEVVINLDSRYADRVERYTSVFREQKDSWSMLEPDLGDYENGMTIDNEKYGTFLHSQIMNENDKTSKKIYGLFFDGELGFFTNPFYGYYDFCYCIALIKPNQTIPERDTYAYIVFRIDSETNELVIEKNWNQGKLLVSPYLTYDEIEEYMGLRTESHVFYGPI